MRLTLRTLLAYLDDILEPAQAKEIGAKINESEIASSLANRIREVMRRRRLTAPDLEGPASGIDPNVVAEYLDNTLSANLVADLEKVCLESDMHLAEVAASHQILTLVLGEPVEIRAQSRERMYALAPPAPPVDPAAEPEWTGEPPSSADSNGAETASKKPAQPVKSLAETIPDYLKPKPLWKRMSPYVLVLVLLAAFFGLVLTDKGLFPHLFDDDTTVANNGDPTPPGESIAANQQKTDIPPNNAKQGVGAKSANAGKQPATPNARPMPVGKDGMPPVAGIDRKPPPDASEKRPPIGKTPPIAGVKQPGTPRKGTQPPSKAVVAKIPKKPIGQPVPKRKVEPPVVNMKAPDLAFDPRGDRGLVLRDDPGSDDWHVLTRETKLNANDVLASPEPFDSQIEVNRGRSTVTLTAGTSVRVLPPSAAAAYGFELRHGRIIVRSKTIPMQGEIDERVFSVMVRGELWRVELLTPDAVCGIEMLPVPAIGYEVVPGPEAYPATLYACKGTVRVSNRRNQVVAVKGDDNFCGILSLNGNVPKPKQGDAVGQVSEGEIPSWIIPAGRRKSYQVDRYAALYRKKFDGTGNALAVLKGKGISLRENVTELVQARRPLIAQFAVQSLAATDSHADLVQALSRTQHEEARKAAVNGLRRWLSADPAHRKQLKAALAKTWPPADASAIYRLLWGFTEADARDPAKSRELVDWLGHSHDAIRELAFENVYRLTRRRFGYRPLLTKSQRGLAMSRWNAHLSKTGALLPPKKVE